MSDTDDDEPITLSSHALAALAEFNAEKDAHRDRFEQLRAAAEDSHAQTQQARAAPLSIDVFAEDWNESQFWYSDDTAKTLAEALLAGAGADSAIAVVSAPSVFVALKNILSAREPDEPRPTLTLLEHDQRFAVFSEFVTYDFAEPFRLPARLKGAFDRIICDPPFLSEDCQTKAALTARWLLKQPGSSPNTPRIVVCTGERMESLVTGKLYRALGVLTTTFEPKHARGLSNEFYCYANFDHGDSWTRRQTAEQ